MKKIILASHGDLSFGLKNSIEVIFGDVTNVFAVKTYRGEKITILDSITKLISTFNENDQIFILTDLYGGSVNNDVLTLLDKYPELKIITGMNLSLVLGIVVEKTHLNACEIDTIIKQSQKQIINCKKLMYAREKEEEDDL
ncbi:MAG: PTS sugar transporter subunit IIA [Bacilli bacterium]